LLRRRYTVSDTGGYDISSKLLTFFDDVELIVDGGADYDPVDGESSVVIPYLVRQGLHGYTKDVRAAKNEQGSAEVTKDTDNGGFALNNGFLFSSGDTYIIKIRPMYLGN
jgi:hypothetical protein